MEAGACTYSGDKWTSEIERISDKISTNTLREQVCEELFERDYTLIEGIIAEHKKIIDNGKKRKKKRRKR